MKAGQPKVGTARSGTCKGIFWLAERQRNPHGKRQSSNMDICRDGASSETYQQQFVIFCQVYEPIPKALTNPQ